MDITTLLSGLLWIWFLVMPSGIGQADILTDDLAGLKQPNTVRFRLRSEIRVADQPLMLAGQGAYQQPDRTQMSLDTPEGRIEVVVIGDTLYTLTPSDRTWQRQPLDSGRTPPIRAPSGGAALPPGFEEAASEILASIRLQGEERLEGAPTRHYRGQIDLFKLAELFGADANSIREGVERFLLTIDFWVGTEDHYLHQFGAAVEYRSREPLAGISDAITANLNMTLFDFNQALSIEPPLAQTGPTPTPTPRPAPVQAPAQVPRAPAR